MEHSCLTMDEKGKGRIGDLLKWDLWIGHKLRGDTAVAESCLLRIAC